MSDRIKRPDWLRKRISPGGRGAATVSLLRSLGLHTVCEGANCPNIGECFGRKTVTFMIMGEVCTRNCRFCAVPTGVILPLDSEEPERIGRAAGTLGLAHVVVTSVTRDDLPDGGAAHFAAVVEALRRENPKTTVELLIPDMQGQWEDLETILSAKPDILNHNLETVPSLYPQVRPQADYQRSLELLGHVKKINPKIFTKSGIMVGVGETENQVLALMDDLRRRGCDILTVGQYLRPSPAHLPITDYITPDQFTRYEEEAYVRGFRHVASGPFVRSSYNAFEGMERLSSPGPTDVPRGGFPPYYRRPTE